MNKNKNRFAYFKDMPYDIPLPKYESKFKFLKADKLTQRKINKKDLEIKNLKITNQKALNIKNHLSYKLGNALIKAHKQWYKGGYIKFMFEAIKINKDHKSKR